MDHEKMFDHLAEMKKLILDEETEGSVWLVGEFRDGDDIDGVVCEIGIEKVPTGSAEPRYILYTRAIGEDGLYANTDWVPYDTTSRSLVEVYGTIADAFGEFDTFNWLLLDEIY